LSKWLLVVVIALLRPVLKIIGHLLLAPVKPFPKLELLVVMVVVPCVMNSIQFWVQDSFLSAGGSLQGEASKPLLDH
jgi:hypothetical protein